MVKRVLKLAVAYDGTDYAGWQIQPNGPTIQQSLEGAFQAVTRQHVRTVASGRTDAGVHAVAQVVSCTVDTDLDDAVLVRALNANLAHDIRVHEVATVADDFHAIRSAIAKRYRYVIDDARPPDLFSRRYAWNVPRPLNDAAMQHAATQLLGRHDFSSFEAAGSPRASSVRTLIDLDLQRKVIGQSEKLTIEIEADGFLYNMVRNIVGSLFEVGKGARSADWLGEVLAAQDRKQAGLTAPPHGLFLIAVRYADSHGETP